MIMLITQSFSDKVPIAWVMRNDSQVLYDFFDLSRPKDPKSEMIRKSKDFLKATVGQEKVNKIKSFVKK